jgi:negative regulator of flagellin synthesis FlgM
MTIQINGGSASVSLVQGGASQPGKTGRQDAGVATGTEPAPSTSDSVNLSGAATALNQAQSTLAALPVVDSQRVESIVRAIEAGTYHTDAQRIASKLIGLETSLAAKPK